MGVDGLYFRVSSDRQTTENQFEELLRIAEKDDSARDWCRVRQLLSQCVCTEELSCSSGGSQAVCRVHPATVAELAAHYVYVEQASSGKAGTGPWPMFEQMKRDVVLRKFDRLLVWKVSCLGRDMREVISAVHELADLGVNVFPVRSQTGPINSTMGKLLWVVQAWYAELEKDVRSDAIKAGQASARASGKQIGRPRAVFRRDVVPILREQGLSWRQIASELNTSVGSVRRAFSEFGNS